MRHIDRIENMQHTCVTFGRFDGIHRGHRSVIRELVEESRRTGRQSVVVSCIGSGKEKVLTTEMEKAWLLEELGVDLLLSCSMEDMGEETFIRDVLIGKLGAEVIVAGASCPEMEFLKTCGVRLRIVDTVLDHGEPVTAKRAGEYMRQGNMGRVTELCGHPYIMLGKVVHGKALGRTVGMPTANLKIYGGKSRPPSGVYATRTHVGDFYYSGVTNVGTRPSVDEHPEITIETMLADFDQNIYGEKIVTEFHLFVRGVRKFDGIEAVCQQVQKDMAQVKDYLKNIAEKC